MISIGKVSKVQLVFPKHAYGHLALEKEVDPQPPLGLLVLASYIREKLPDINVEIFDGKRISEAELLRKLDSDVIGLSVWYSNYDNAKRLAEQIKARKPSTKIIMGGPHATAIANRIIKHNPYVDAVICGEGEIAFTQLLKGVPWKNIQGVMYRSNDIISWNSDDQITAERIDLDSLPFFDLELLRPQFLWKNRDNPPAMSAFPLAGIRGCCHIKRCEYCSGHFIGFRSMNPERYWAQVKLLNDKYNINYFFETGDIFPPKLIKLYSQSKHINKVGFRIYSYLGNFKKNDMEYLNKFGVKVIFMGIESILIWKKKFIRKYAYNYGIKSLFKEIEMLRQFNIDLITSFILGLPGETTESLTLNRKIIQYLLQRFNIKEITVSAVLPIPGSAYFRDCLNDSFIKQEYHKLTGNNLLYCDVIDYYILSQLFINRYTNVGYRKTYDLLISLEEKIGTKMAHFGSKIALNNQEY